MHDLAQTNVQLGQYDTAISQYLKALEAHRAADDKSGMALESSDMGAVFAAQGRYDAALKAQQEAVNTLSAVERPPVYDGVGAGRIRTYFVGRGPL